MKKPLIISVLLISASCVNAQHDSLRKIRISAVQAEIGPPLYMDYKELQQRDYQTILKNDPFVNADLNGFQKDGWYRYDGRTFNALAGVKVYAEIKTSRSVKKEIFIGIKYGQENDMGISYSKQTYDTIGVYTDNRTGKNVYEVQNLTSNYGYSIASQKLIMPLGFNFTTNKNRFFWVTWGAEISPVLNFSYVLTSSYRTTATDQLLKDNDSLNKADNSTNFPLHDQHVIENKTKLAGVGYGLYVSAPFAMYLHPFKKAAFLKHLNYFVSISPLYMYSKSKYYGENATATISFATGIRYNW